MIKISLYGAGDNPSDTKFANNNISNSTFNDLSTRVVIEMWSPGIFAHGERLNTKLKSIQLLVLDFDSGQPTLEEARELFAPYRHIIGTSRSHNKVKGSKPACDRFRVILDLGETITNDADYKAAWFAAAARWPTIDAACKDSARFFFPCTEIVSVNDAGLSFTERERYQQRPQVTKSSQNVTKKGRLSKLTKDFLIDGAAEGEWHGRFFKAAMDFKEQGYEVDDARLKLTMVTGHLDEVDEQQLEDVYENREPKYEAREITFISDWPVYILDKDGESTDKPSSQAPQNYRHLFEKLGMRFKQNDLDNLLYCNGEFWTEEDFLSLWVTGKDYGLHGSKDLLFSTVTDLAMSARFNPVSDMINSKKWNGQDNYIDQLFNTLSFADGEPVELYKEYLTKWLVGIVAKLYTPGSQNLVLTFVGEQGIGKSRWLTNLALWDKAFGEGEIDPSNKDHELRHLTNVIWHIPELDYTTGKRETGALKAYLTKDYIAVRPAFSRLLRQGRSVCSFAASVNTDEFLVDPTGNRRFLTLPVEAIDHEHSVDTQQVFAQALALHQSGYKHWLDKDEIIGLSKHNSRFEMQDVLSALAATIEPGQDEMTALELLADLGYKEPHRGDISRFGTLLKRAGIKKFRSTVNAGNQKRRTVWLVKSPKGFNSLRLPKPC